MIYSWIAMKIDLHTHTVHSDGFDTPEELMREAEALGIGVIAVTDHDTMAGLEDAEKEAAGRGIRFIPGIELSVYAEGREVHILGYFVDPEHPVLKGFVEEQRQSRVNRIYEMLEKLGSIGVHIPPEDVIVEGKKGTMGRPHVARALVKHGYIAEEDQAFRKYIGRDQPGYVPRKKAGAEEGIRRLRESGAIPVLAHPGLYARDGLIEKMIDAGVMGIEAYHPDHSGSNSRSYLRLAEERGLLVTGGSDHHGKKSKYSALGTVSVPESVLEPLEAAASLARKGEKP